MRKSENINMFTLVREEEYIAFTLVADPLNVEPLITRIHEFAPEWGFDNAAKVAVVLRSLLSCVASQGDRQARSSKVYCWIERIPEGPFQITVEDDGAGYTFTRLDPMMTLVEPEWQYPGHEALIQLCRQMRVTPPGNRVSVLVDAEESEQEWDGRQ